MQIYVAVLTPFDGRGRVDLARLRAHVLWLLAQGIDGFVPTAVTGEFLYLTDREREAVHRTVLDAAPDKPVFPCTWDPSPATTAYLTEAARANGATGVLLPPPLLYALDPGALRQWYASIADKGLPVWAYHHPRRLHAPVPPEVYESLRDSGLLAGLMDASEDIWRIRRVAELDPGAVIAGGDRLLPQITSVPGVTAFVSSVANAWPDLCLRILRQQEHQLLDALVDRVNQLERAGGIRALKSLLRMGCRSPLIEPPDDALMGLPPAEGPS